MSHNESGLFPAEAVGGNEEEEADVVDKLMSKFKTAEESIREGQGSPEAKEAKLSLLNQTQELMIEAIEAPLLYKAVSIYILAAAGYAVGYICGGIDLGESALIAGTGVLATLIGSSLVSELIDVFVPLNK